MVNVKTERLIEILDMLRTADRPVSGENLAGKLGVSRVAVWKNINSLRDSGYRIESSGSGYRLISAPEKPLPWEMTGLSTEIEYFSETESTMEKAHRLFESGCETGTTVIAGTQTQGRSADGGKWKSPEGGLYLTRIRTLPFPTYFSGLYAAAVCSSVIRILDSSYGIRAELSWPSGITVDSRKIGGVLSEYRGKNGTTLFIAAGIGININSENEKLPEGAASIRALTGKNISVKDFTVELLEGLNALDELFPAELDKIIAGCNSMLSCINQSAAVIRSENIRVSGVVSGINPDGTLCLKSDCGAVSIYHGEKPEYE